MSNNKYRNRGPKKAETSFDRAKKLANEYVIEWFEKHGGKTFELLLESAQEDIELHLMESKERKEMAKRGTEPPKRWQVAPGIAAQCRAQILKIIDRIEDLNVRKWGEYTAMLNDLGFNPDGSKFTSFGCEPKGYSQETKMETGKLNSKPESKAEVQPKEPAQACT